MQYQVWPRLVQNLETIRYRLDEATVQYGLNGSKSADNYLTLRYANGLQGYYTILTRIRHGVYGD